MSVYSKANPFHLSRALSSILDQTVTPDEVVLVKDGPITPELEGVIQQFSISCPALRIVTLERNAGLGVALQTGLVECRYDIVARMDADDICVRNRFEKQLEILAADNTVAVVGSAIGEFYDDENSIAFVRKVPVTYEEVWRVARYRNPLNHMTVMFRKDAVMAVGGYQHAPGLEDYYLWVRLLNAGFKIVNIDEILVLARTGQSMYSRRGGWSYFRAEFDLQEKFLRMGFIGPAVFLLNVSGRMLVRLLPNNGRRLVYERFLRLRV